MSDEAIIHAPQPTPTELALIAATLLSSETEWTEKSCKRAVGVAHALWCEAHRFCEAQAGRSAAGKEGSP